jgi:hypothetical protein
MIMKASYAKKTMFLNTSFIRKARKILSAKTEKDAVNRALEIVVEENAIIRAHKEIAGVGTIEKIYR